jgi:hypothetical protein
MDANGSPDPDPTAPETKEAEHHEAQVTSGADRPPTPEEEQAAERVAAEVPDEAAEHYKEMAERGANVKGEGAIEG